MYNSQEVCIKKRSVFKKGFSFTPVFPLSSFAMTSAHPMKPTITEPFTLLNLCPLLSCGKTVFCTHDMSVWLLIHPTLICLLEQNWVRRGSSWRNFAMYFHCTVQNKRFWFFTFWCVLHLRVHCPCKIAAQVHPVAASGLPSSWVLIVPCLLVSLKVEFVFVSYFGVTVEREEWMLWTSTIKVEDLSLFWAISFFSIIKSDFPHFWFSQEAAVFFSNSGPHQVSKWGQILCPQKALPWPSPSASPFCLLSILGVANTALRYTIFLL